MDKGVTCEHLNKLVDFLEKDLWQSKESLTCFDCGCPGPNLWICLQPDCHHIGCSEVKNDHSTLHQKLFISSKHKLFPNDGWNKDSSRQIVLICLGIYDFGNLVHISTQNLHLLLILIDSVSSKEDVTLPPSPESDYFIEDEIEENSNIEEEEDDDNNHDEDPPHGHSMWGIGLW
ncbi:unnamed protein product [Euphydryas editha]|uniref:UBP-type domain-containing protein n=1 Tax=Euphydryas editha TaxID=104508 RepID=A0AAU9UIJ4_EUPED|nr:unnamed protein product [Euphydryas editha]